jgi:tRNA(fMet)-specific endonuclease VapC
MNFLLDTSICIYLISQRPPEIIRRFRQHQPGDIAISVITVSELYAGLAKSRKREEGEEGLEAFLAPFELLPYDTEAVRSYGKIQAEVDQQGLLVSPLDVFIAAQALSKDLILVSNTDQDFMKIPGLRFENWHSTVPQP